MALIERDRIAPALLCCAAAGAALTLAVVYASAAIRLGQAATPPLDAGALAILRAAHRAAASLEVAVALLLAWLAWRARGQRPQVASGVALVVILTIALSFLGIAAGRNPPPLAALGNLLGGLALVAAFAWLLGVLRDRRSRPGRPQAAILLAVQCALGASLSTLPWTRVSGLVPLHGILGIVSAVVVFLLARRASTPARRATGIALACLVPVAGFSVLHFEGSAVAAFLHTAAAALLVAAAAYSRLRPA